MTRNEAILQPPGTPSGASGPGRSPPSFAAPFQFVAALLANTTSLLTALATGAAKVAAIGAVGLILLILAKAVFEDAVVVQPIAVPRSLADNGFASDISAQRLRDEMATLVAQADSSAHIRQIVDQGDATDIVVPTIGISVQTLATQIRTFLKISSHQTISGEFTVNGKGFSLRLRRDGHRFFAGDTGDTGNLDDLMHRAALATMRATQPYVFASAVFPTDKAAALEAVDAIIRDGKPTDKDVVLARTLRGNILEAQGEHRQAIQEIGAALAADVRSAPAHNDLANVYARAKNYTEAISEYQAAARLDETTQVPLRNLGLVLDEIGQSQRAIDTFQEAIRRQPKIATAYVYLGDALAKMKRFDEARSRYDEALALDAGNAGARDGLAALGRRVVPTSPAK